jgi:hypothetical protein
MNTLRFIFYGLLLTINHSEGGLDQIGNPQKLFDDSDFVGVVQFFDNYDEAKVFESFKGNFKVILSSGYNLSFQKEQRYLLFAKLDNVSISHINSIVSIDDVSFELDRFLKQLPCFIKSETIEEKQKRNPNITGACHRIMDPVCGCDGVSYDNICEMGKKGIVRFISGDCK